MDTDLSPEQEELRNSARKFLESRVPTSAVRALEAEGVGYDLTVWSEMASLGWQGVMIPSDFGGSALDFVELTILMEEIGRSLCPGPLPTTLLASLAILGGGTDAQKQEWLPAIASGAAIWTVAFVEPAGSWELDDLAFEISEVGDELRLSGTKMFVPDAHVADWILVIGMFGGRPEAVAVERASKQLRIEPLQTISSDRQYRLDFDAVSAPKSQMLAGDPSGAWLGDLIYRATIMECAYLTGLARKDLELAVEHATHRVQFGQPIGAFQAIRHACANMLTDVDGSWLTTYKAAWSVSEGMDDIPIAASIAKGWTSEASARVVGTCQQISGAMGFTRDYDAQLYFRRQKKSELSWGDADFHREKVATLLDINDAATAVVNRDAVRSRNV